MSIFGLDCYLQFGNMVALGLVSAFVSDVGDGVDNSVGTGVSVRTADFEGLVLSALVLELSLLLGGNAV